MSEHTLLTVGWTESSAPVRAITYLKERTLNRLFKCHFPSSTSAEHSCRFILKGNGNLQSFLFFVNSRHSVQLISFSWITEGESSIFFFSTKQAPLFSERDLPNKR